MEPHPGVFVSNISATEWEDDPEVPGSEIHELVNADGVWAGLTRFSAVEGPASWTPRQREVIHGPRRKRTHRHLWGSDS
jgi:hypothetical protein